MEIASHVAEALARRGSSRDVRTQLAAECVAGAFDDLVWCNEVRISGGRRGLVTEALLGPRGASVIAGLAIVAGFVFSLSDVSPYPVLREVSVAIAAAVTVVSVLDRALEWNRRRRIR